MPSFDGIVKKIPPDLGVEIWQAIVDLMGLPEVTVTYDQYPPMTLKPDMPGWAQHLATQSEGVLTSGHYVFRQAVHFSQAEEDQHVERWPEYYLPLFLARETSRVAADNSEIRNDRMLMDMLRENFLRCRHMPTFQNGDPVPGFGITCCRKPLACERSLLRA